MGYSVTDINTIVRSVLVRGSCKEWCCLRNQSIAVVLSQPHNKDILKSGGTPLFFSLVRTQQSNEWMGTQVDGQMDHTNAFNILSLSDGRVCSV